MGVLKRTISPWSAYGYFQEGALWGRGGVAKYPVNQEVCDRCTEQAGDSECIK